MRSVPTDERSAPRESAARRQRIAPTPRNVALLRELHDTLSATLTASAREAAIRRVEATVAATPEPRLLAKARDRWAWRIGTLFAALDLAAVVLAWLVGPHPHAVAPLVAAALVMLVVCNRADLHRSRLELAVLDDVPAYALASIIGGLTLAAVDSFGRAGAGARDALAFGSLSFVFFVLSRVLAFPVVRRLRRSRLIAHPVVIVGTGEVGQRLAAAMRSHPEYGLKPVGFVDFDSEARQREKLLLPVLGDIGSLPEILRQYAAREIVFAFSSQPDADVVRIVRGCVRLALQVFVVPRYFELCGADRKARIEALWGIPLMRLRRWPLQRGNRWLKRLMDVSVAAGALVLLAPVLAACALAVRLEGGPVLFRQRRVGRGGRPFVLYKFRSMRSADDGDRRWSVTGDPRVTRVGRFLRWSSLDELPQLINVLRGDMSLVGPRPERPFFVRSFSTRVRRYGERHRVAAGLTGFAQVNGLRGDTSIEDRVTFDNYYIENWSLWSDVKIILRTVTSLLRHRPAETPAAVTVELVPRAAVPDAMAS